MTGGKIDVVVHHHVFKFLLGTGVLKTSRVRQLREGIGWTFFIRQNRVGSLQFVHAVFVGQVAQHHFDPFIV